VALVNYNGHLQELWGLDSFLSGFSNLGTEEFLEVSKTKTAKAAKVMVE
jgi:hypothetical protein